MLTRRAALGGLLLARPALAQVSCQSVGFEASPGLVVTTVNYPLNASPSPGFIGSGNLLTITSAGKLSLNGTVFAATSGVTAIVYINHCAYQYGFGSYYGPVTAATSGATALSGSPLPTIGLSSSTIAHGQPQGSLIGTLSVTTGLAAGGIGPGAYPWIYSVTGLTAATVSGNQLLTNGVLPAGTFNVTIFAENPTILGSPFSLPLTLTVT